MAEPRVSVLMLTFNRPQFISRAIESICRQTFPDWELLVVHDGPHEKVGEIVREWEHRDGRVRYLRRQQAGNIAQANNYGLARSQGEYIAILDDDDYWPLSEKLAVQVRFLDEHPDHAACGGGAICIDLNGNEMLRYMKPSADEQIKRHALLANPMVHSSTVYRRQAADQCGYYDESLPGFQDWDLFLKIGRIGKLYNFLEYFLCYQIWEGSGTFAYSTRNTRSALRIVRRHRPYYQGYPVALAMAGFYHCYAHLPASIRSLTYSSLSRLKKSIFSAQGNRSS